MKGIGLSPYELKLLGSTATRRGFLLRVQGDEGAFGYADIFPWPEFGDPSIKHIPELLREGQETPLLKRSLEMAKGDALARKQGVSLLDGKEVANHLLVSGFDFKSLDRVLEKLHSGFQKVKVKVGREPREEQKFLHELCLNYDGKNFLRLDFNGRYDLDYLHWLETHAHRVECIEDLSFDPKNWQSSKFELAYDQPGFLWEDVKTSWQVIKPAKQGKAEILAENIIFTSYLGHPVGQAHGMVESLSWGKQERDYGFLSHEAYEKNDFSERWILQENRLSLPTDLGVGFSDLLVGLEWVEL